MVLGAFGGTTTVVLVVVGAAVGGGEAVGRFGDTGAVGTSGGVVTVTTGMP